MSETKEVKELKEYNKYETQWILILEEVESITIATHTDLSIAEWLQKKAQKARIEIDKTRESLVKPYNDIVWQINSRAKELTLPITEAEQKIKIKMIKFQQEEEERRQKREREVQEKILLIKKTTNEEELQNLIVSFWDIEDTRIYTACEMQNIEFEKIRKEAEEKKIREAEEKRLEEMKKEQSEEQARLEAQKIEIEREQRKLENERFDLEQQKLAKEVWVKETTPVKIKWERMVTKFKVINENEVPRNLCSPDESKIRKMIDAGFEDIAWVKVWKEKAIY